MDYVDVKLKIPSSTTQKNFGFKFPIHKESDGKVDLNSFIKVVTDVDNETNQFLTCFVENGKISPNKLNRCCHGFPYSKNECLISPSHWTCPGDDAHPDEVIARFVRKMLHFASDLKQSPIDGEFDIGCGKNKNNEKSNHRMDIYGTKVLPMNSPILAFVHGGYWQFGSRQCSKSMVRSLVSSGIIVAVIGYDLAPTVTLEEMISEITESVNYLNSWALERASRGLYIAGHSAGAHLTFMALLRSESILNSIKGAILLGGVYDLEPLVDTYVNEPLKLDATSAKKNSPTMHVEELAQKLSKLKLGVLVGEYESSTFIEASSNLCEKFRQYGIDASFATMANEDHFSIIENLSDMNSEIYQFVYNFMI